MNSNTINIFLADDHPVFREGIRLLLENEQGLKIVGEAANGQEVMSKIKNLPVDVLIMDIDMPDMNGLILLEKLQHNAPSVKVLVFSMYDYDHYVQHMLGKGARGYILKSCRKSELIWAIKTVNAGDSYLGKEISKKLLHSLDHPSKQTEGITDIPLTKREIEVIKLVATGKTNQEIGALLNISHRTVDTHRRNIMEKLNLHNAAALTSYAAKKGLLDIE